MWRPPVSILNASLVVSFLPCRLNKGSVYMHFLLSRPIPHAVGRDPLPLVWLDWWVNFPTSTVTVYLDLEWVLLEMLVLLVYV